MQAAKNIFLYLILLCLLMFQFGCAVKNTKVPEDDLKDDLVIEVPLPGEKPIIKPLPKNEPVQKSTVQKQTLTAGSANNRQAVINDKANPPELNYLLNLKANKKVESTVMLLRPNAIRDAAQLVTIQTAISWRYAQLVSQVEKYAAIMDTAFNFSPLLMTQGDALIMPPVLTRGGASMRIEAHKLATATVASYELLEPARFISVIPTWRSYLMMIEDFPKPEEPNPAVMPKNLKEQVIWQTAVREAWIQGIAEAEQLFIENISRMVRDYRGIMLYHLLIAQDLLSNVHSASTDLGIYISKNKLNIGQKVYRITAPSIFTVPRVNKRK